MLNATEMAARTSADAILFRHARKVLPPAPATGAEPAAVSTTVATVVANLLALGFRPDADLLTSLRAASEAGLVAWHSRVTSLLRDAVGADINAVTPFYPGFPRQVMEASDAELLIRALCHYISGGQIRPDAKDPVVRRALTAAPAAKSLGQTDDDALFDVAADLFSSPLSWGEPEMTEMAFLLVNHEGYGVDAYTVRRELGETVVSLNRENKAILWNMAQSMGSPLRDTVETLFDSATDVLRAAAVYSGASASLPGLVKTLDPSASNRIRFRSFPNRVRRFFLSVVENDKHRDAALARHEALWKTLGEKIHPGRFASRYPLAAQAFSDLRNGRLVGPNSAVEKAYVTKDVPSLLAELSKNPGALIRNIDHLLRVADESRGETKDVIIAALRAAQSGVSTNVLWQARAHFENRSREARAVFPKGSAAKVRVLDALPALPVFDEDDVMISLDLALQHGLRVAYGKRETMEGERVFIDPALQNLLVPNALRNASASLNVVGRGSRIALPNMEDGTPGSVVRVFMHWKNSPHGYGTDVDLSAALYSEDFKKVNNLWYGALRFGSEAVHSGDVVDAPNGAAEYIDIDMDKALRNGYRYVGVTVHSYSGEPFSDIPETFAGVQVRDTLGAREGEVFDARTVTEKFTITSEGRNTMPLLFDLETREMIWVDLNINSRAIGGQNVVNTADDAASVLRGVLSMARPSVAQVLSENVFARGGKMVSDPAEATKTYQYTADGLRENDDALPMSKFLAEYL